jgi:hypothetical protein
VGFCLYPSRSSGFFFVISDCEISMLRKVIVF